MCMEGSCKFTCQRYAGSRTSRAAWHKGAIDGQTDMTEGMTGREKEREGGYDRKRERERGQG